MTTFTLVTNILLIVCGVFAVVTLAYITVLALHTIVAVQQIRRQIRPLAGQVWQFAATASAFADTVRHTAREIKRGVDATSDEVTERTRKTAWLYRRVFSAPGIALAALATGVQRGVRIWRGRRHPRPVVVIKRVAPPERRATMILRPTAEQHDEIESLRRAA